MGSFGERLQREREMRGITLEEIAEATKIGTRSLRALEEQDFDKLPGGIFNKGFVRAYARYLGLDEEQAVADYLSALSEAQAAGKVTRQETASGAPEQPIFVPEAEEKEPIRLPLGLIATAIAAAALLFGGWRYYTAYGFRNLLHVHSGTNSTPARAARPVTRPSPPPSGEPTPSALAAPTAPLSTLPRPPEADGFVVRVKAKESSWISITADGKLIMQGVLPAASDKMFRARRNLELKTGNAGGIELFHNDKPVASLGSDGQVKTVEFTLAGLRD